jgi:hypothetical protein
MIENGERRKGALTDHGRKNLPYEKHLFPALAISVEIVNEQASMTKLLYNASVLTLAD